MGLQLFTRGMLSRVQFRGIRVYARMVVCAYCVAPMDIRFMSMCTLCVTMARRRVHGGVGPIFLHQFFRGFSRLSSSSGVRPYKGHVKLYRRQFFLGVHSPKVFVRASSSRATSVHVHQRVLTYGNGVYFLYSVGLRRIVMVRLVRAIATKCSRVQFIAIFRRVGVLVRNVYHTAVPIAIFYHGNQYGRVRASLFSSGVPPF